ncbi:MAG TPA: heparan N-sulfatase [Bacteroides sp.]|nr:heparan N-sulfatase [Bacteroides sp.]
MNKHGLFAFSLILTWSIVLVSCNREPEIVRPNILFCIADDASFPHMGAYGCDWVKTPSFDRIAEQGILFTNAYTPNAKCSPSRSCILTGRNTWQLEEACNHVPFFPEKFKVYTEALAEHGYYTGMTGKGWAPGEPGTRNGKPRHLAGIPFKEIKLKPPTSGIAAVDYSRNFGEFLKTVPEGEPWCFWYGGHEPHRAYEYGSGVALGGKETADIDQVPDFWPDTDIARNDILDYAYEIEYFDKHLGGILKQLEIEGLLENTLIVVTADNGMPFPRIKGQEYELSNHLPLAIMWKDGIKSPGRIVNDMVSFIDFAPTFIEVAGLDWEETGMASSPGRSLYGIFKSGNESRAEHRNHIVIGKERHDVGRPDDQGYPIRGIVRDGYLYLRNFEPSRWPVGNPETGYLNTDGSPTKTQILEMRRQDKNSEYWEMNFGKRPDEELYQISEDPYCMNNLADDEAYEKLKQQMRDLLFLELQTQEDPRILGQGHIFDEYVYADTATRDFYNRFMAGETMKAGWVEKSDFEPQPIRE